jgi:sterol 3beta-glucosyltransferase
MKPVVLLTSGTRGDLLPYLALAEGLRWAGRLVRVAAPLEFKELVEERGLPFAPLDGNPSELMTRGGGQSALTYDGSWLRSLQATRRYLQAARPLYQRMLSSAAGACQDAAALVIGLPSTWGSHIAEAMGIPCIWAFLQPFSRTGEFSSALLPARLRLGKGLNRLSHLLVEQAAWQTWRAQINHWRKSDLDLSPAPLAGPFARLYDQTTPVLYGFSPLVVPAPADWPAWHRVTGYWFPEEANWQPPEGLKRFIEVHPRLLYIGFGSPGTRQPQETLQIVLQALAEADLRAVLAFPEELHTRMHLPESVYPLASAPHAWLFPRMAALVHHGGAGTTAAGLRAGVPALLTPLAIDQFFWGERLAALGAGPQPLPQRRLSAGRLAQALERLVYDTEMRRVSHRLGEAIRAEKGVETAVAHITAVL